MGFVPLVHAVSGDLTCHLDLMVKMRERSMLGSYCEHLFVWYNHRSLATLPSYAILFRG
jgi:hypothetical protein